MNNKITGPNSNTEFILNLEKILVGNEFFYCRNNSDKWFLKEGIAGDEFNQITNLLSSIKRPFCVLDAGSYIGTFAIRLVNQLPLAHVVCAEASPENFLMSCLNTQSYNRIKVVHAGITASSGKMKVMARKTGNCGHTLISNPLDDQSPLEIGSVETFSIGDFMERHSFSLPWAMTKLDIEGSERDIFNEDSVISKCPLISAEIHDKIIYGCSLAWKHFLQRNECFEEIKEKGEKVLGINRSKYKLLC